MKTKKKLCVIAIISGLAISGVIIGYNNLPVNVNASTQFESEELITNASITKEQKIILEKKYTENMIEEVLRKCEFETEEEENKYRELFYEQFLK